MSHQYLSCFCNAYIHDKYSRGMKVQVKEWNFLTLIHFYWNQNCIDETPKALLIHFFGLFIEERWTEMNQKLICITQSKHNIDDINKNKLKSVALKIIRYISLDIYITLIKHFWQWYVSNKTHKSINLLSALSQHYFRINVFVMMFYVAKRKGLS